MIALHDFLLRSGVSVTKYTIFENRLNDFLQAYPDKRVFTKKDIADYCKENKTHAQQMKVIERFLRLNFKLVSRTKKSHVRKSLPVRLMIQSFLQDLKRRNYSDRTIRSYREELKAFAEFLNDINIETLDDVDKNIMFLYKDRLYRQKHTKGAHYSLRSQISYLQRAKSLFDYLVREEYLLLNPCMSLTVPREIRKVSRNLLTRNEIDDFFSVIDTDNVYGFLDRTVFELLYSTGLRISELYDLTLNAVNIEDGLVHVYDGKGRIDRTCPLTIIAKRYLAVYIHKVREQYLHPDSNTDRVFPSYMGNRLETTWMTGRIKRYRELAGIQYPISAYAFRRSFATHLLQQGVNIRYIQQLMGHRSIRTTLRYIHITVSDLRNVILQYHPREKQLAGKEISFKGE